MGEESKSEEAYRESLTQVAAFRGELHGDTALAHSNLAGVLLDQDRFGEAREHYEQSLEIRRKIFPKDHASISQSLLELGKAWGRVGRYERAFMCLQKCKEMRLRNTTSLFGRDHARVADVILQIGRLEDKRGASGQAVKEFRQCLLIRDRVHEGVHASIASVLIHLGHALHHIGHNDEAIEHLERCLEMRLELFGDAHLRTASAHSSMAYVLEGMGRFQDALSHQVSCTKIRQAELSEDHSDFVESKQEMVRLAFVVASQSGGDVIPIRGSED
jgi:tetratricopeptide (TPR) repeat protein